MRRLGGTAVALVNLSVVSGSGFDYTQADVASVPDPAAAWLLSVGVVCLWCVRKRGGAGLQAQR